MYEYKRFSLLTKTDGKASIKPNKSQVSGKVNPMEADRDQREPADKNIATNKNNSDQTSDSKQLFTEVNNRTLIFELRPIHANNRQCQVELPDETAKRVV